MQVIYAREKLEPSIFLAGPTPRDHFVKSWRPEALQLLSDYGFDGKVFVPEDRDVGDSTEKRSFSMDAQVFWEWQALDSATVIMFWVPRELETMPAFTTNVEFGMYASSGKVLFGCPKDAVKVKYLISLARRFNITLYDNLPQLVSNTISKTRMMYSKT